MDLTKNRHPNAVDAKWTKGKAGTRTITERKAREGDELFDLFLKELELAGKHVRRGFYNCTDYTVQFAEIYVRGRWLVGMGARLDYFVVWGTFIDGSIMDVLTPIQRTHGEYETTFKDAEEAMDWVADYIRSVDALP
jgi:hypothetical protein